jgi:hypothetical protein
MKSRPHLLLLVCLAGLIVVTSGCRQPDKPKQFSNRIARSNKRLAEAARKFFTACDPMRKGQQPKTSDAQSAYNDMRLAVAELQKEFDQVKPPANASEGDTLLAIYKDFLVNEKALFDTHITQAWQIVQDNRYAPKAKWDMIEPLLQKVPAEERPYLNQVKNAHKEYCEKFVLDPKKG